MNAHAILGKRLNTCWKRESFQSFKTSFFVSRLRIVWPAFSPFLFNPSNFSWVTSLSPLSRIFNVVHGSVGVKSNANHHARYIKDKVPRTLQAVPFGIDSNLSGPIIVYIDRVDRAGIDIDNRPIYSVGRILITSHGTFGVG